MSKAAMERWRTAAKATVAAAAAVDVSVSAALAVVEPATPFSHHTGLFSKDKTVLEL